MGGISISTLIALSLMLLFLYVSTIGMIWAISMDEKNIPESIEEDSNFAEKTRFFFGVDLRGNEVTIRNLRKKRATSSKKTGEEWIEMRFLGLPRFLILIEGLHG